MALPLALTIASIVCMLIAMLAGITDKNLSLFEVETKNLSLSSETLQNLADNLKVRDLSLDALTRAGLEDNIPSVEDVKNTLTGGGGNITAKTLGLADTYKVSLWNYCGKTDGKSSCTKAKFDWASTQLNTTSLTSATDPSVTVNLPKEVKGALKTFEHVSKWTQVVYIVAIISAAIELIFGLFAICSRIGSCCTMIVSSISTTAIIAASIMATVQASVVVGALKTAAKAYGVNARFNTSFLAATWASAAFSIAAGLFWLFTMCCCASSHDKKNKNAAPKSGGMGMAGLKMPWGKRNSGHGDSEKLIPTGAYQRVGDGPDHHAFAGQTHGVYNNQEYGVPMHNVKPTRGNGAYEPYSHTNV